MLRQKEKRKLEQFNIEPYESRSKERLFCLREKASPPAVAGAITNNGGIPDEECEHLYR
ncbi:MAG: hypothetical protein QM610_05910 [Chitinophagaceae bacterium]